MSDDDLDELFQMLDDVHELRGLRPLSVRAKALFAQQVADYPMRIIRGAISAHLRGPSGKYTVPMQPAHVIEEITGALANDGRPAVDEAWSIALQIRDEAASARVTPEIVGALAVCRPVLDTGDKVGARMAFKDAYARLVTDARAAGRPTEWTLSLGTDAQRRAEVAEEAVLAGQLQLEHARPLMLAAPRAAEGPTAVGRKALEAIRALTARMALPSDDAAAARRDFDQLKAQSEQRVRDYQAQQA